MNILSKRLETIASGLDYLASKGITKPANELHDIAVDVAALEQKCAQQAQELAKLKEAA